MGKYSLEELMRRWFTEELTAEQVIGQLLQMMKEIETRLDLLEDGAAIQVSDQLTSE